MNKNKEGSPNDSNMSGNGIDTDTNSGSDTNENFFKTLWIKQVITRKSAKKKFKEKNLATREREEQQKKAKTIKEDKNNRAKEREEYTAIECDKELELNELKKRNEQLEEEYKRHRKTQDIIMSELSQLAGLIDGICLTDEYKSNKSNYSNISEHSSLIKVIQSGIAKADKRFKNALKNVDEYHKEGKKEIELQHKKDLALLEQKHDAIILQYKNEKADSDAELTQLYNDEKKKVVKTQELYQEMIEKCKIKCEDEKATLTRTHNEELRKSADNYKRETNIVKSKYDSEIEGIKNKYNSEIEEIKSKYNSEILSIKSSNAAEKEKIMDMVGGVFKIYDMYMALCDTDREPFYDIINTHSVEVFIVSAVNYNTLKLMHSVLYNHLRDKGYDFSVAKRDEALRTIWKELFALYIKSNKNPLIRIINIEPGDRFDSDLCFRKAGVSASVITGIMLDGIVDASGHVIEKTIVY